MNARLFSLMLLSMISSALLRAADDKPLDGDLKELQGEWEATDFKIQGKSIPDEKIKEFRLTIKGNDFSFHTIDGDKDARKAALTLDATTTPKALDLVPDSGPEKGKTIRGIYALDEGKLRLCIPNHAGEADNRPKEFKSAEDGNLALIFLERVKEK